MTYDELIETISVIVENDKIHKTGLTLIYELDELNHTKMNEQLFYSKNNHLTDPFIKSDEFEVQVNGLLIKFIKKQ